MREVVLLLARSRVERSMMDNRYEKEEMERPQPGFGGTRMR
jgi:hypothetical protein